MNATGDEDGKRRRVSSLSARLAIAIVLVLGAGGGAVTFAALAYGSRAARETYDRLLLGAADQIAASTDVLDGRPVVDMPTSAFELLALARDDRIIYRIVDNAGATLTGYAELALPPPARDGGIDASFHDLRFRGAPIRVVRLQRRFAERAFSGSVTVLVGHTLRARAALAGEIAGGIALTASLAGLCMALLAIYAVYSALRPLRRIERGFESRDPRDLTPLEVPMPRELRPMVDAINHFMARLARQVKVTENLIADSAHQLRTPIAALRAQAELASEEDDPEALRVALARIHARSRTLSRLADQLLNRALIIHRADSTLPAVLDLRGIAVRTAEEFDLGHDNDAAELRLELPEIAVPVRGDALSLCEACKNLVGNAFAHGLPPVTLAVVVAGATATLAVRDRGAGMAPEATARLGHRFEGGGPLGGGIGLAIVNEVAIAHAARLRSGTTAAGEFEMTLTLGREPE